MLQVTEKDCFIAILPLLIYVWFWKTFRLTLRICISIYIVPFGYLHVYDIIKSRIRIISHYQNLIIVFEVCTTVWKCSYLLFISAFGGALKSFVIWGTLYCCKEFAPVFGDNWCSKENIALCFWCQKNNRHIIIPCCLKKKKVISYRLFVYCYTSSHINPQTGLFTSKRSQWTDSTQALIGFIKKWIHNQMDCLIISLSNSLKSSKWN